MKWSWSNFLWNKSIEGFSFNAQDIDQVYFNLKYLSNSVNHKYITLVISLLFHSIYILS